MEMDEVLKLVGDYVSGKKEVELSKDELKTIKLGFDEVKKDIDWLIQNDNYVPDNNKNKLVRNSIMVIMNKSLVVPFTDSFRSLCESYSNLIFSWNENTIKDPELETITSFLLRSTKNHYTMIEVCDLLKYLSKYLSDIKAWSPPAFEISRHYYNVLQSQLDGEIKEIAKGQEQKKSC